MRELAQAVDDGASDERQIGEAEAVVGLPLALDLAVRTTSTLAKSISTTLNACGLVALLITMWSPVSRRIFDNGTVVSRSPATTGGADAAGRGAELAAALAGALGAAGSAGALGAAGPEGPQQEPGPGGWNRSHRCGRSRRRG
jgi:hypothetical protein